MNENQEKRMISDTGYEVAQAFHINGKEVLLAENQLAEDGQRYLVANYTEKGIIGEYADAVTCTDYLEAVQEFTGRIGKEAARIQAEKDAVGLPSKLFTAEDCFPRHYEESIEGKVVVIKSSVFSPEYRRGDNQLVLAIHGNGVGINPIGRAVYCYHLNDGKHTRFERYEVLGVIRPEAMPDWAKESLARLQAELNKPFAERQYVGNYEIIQNIEAGRKVFVLGHNPKAPQPYGTWESTKNSVRGFDCGHYFSIHEAAENDLHARAGKEQKYLDGKKRTDKDR